MLEDQRLLYNAALQERIDAWSKARVSVSYVDQCRSLTEVRSDFPESYGQLPVSLSRGTLKRLDLAFQAFFRRVKLGQTPGFPRFKPMSRFDSIGFTEMSGIRVLDEGKKIAIKGVSGSIRVRQHRPLPEGSAPKSVILKRSGRHWTLSLLIAIPLTEPSQWRPVEDNPLPDIGIDLGIESFLTTSDGKRISGPNAGKSATARLRRLQRSLSRKKKGSRRRESVKARLAKCHEHLSNIRKDHAHKLSASMAKRYRVIVAEELSIVTMTRSARGSLESPGSKVRQKAGLNCSLLDQSWGDFLFKLSYKAESAGGRVVLVKPHGTSQQCSACGAVVPKTLNQRLHRCSCGLILHRDHNAARNILLRADREDKIPARLQPMVGETGCRESCAKSQDAPND